MGDYFRGAYLPFTGQTTLNTKQVKRTKFFFGYRYMWSAQQLNEPFSNISAGVRNDVSPIPLWMKKKIEKPMVDAEVCEKDFINSIAMNIYHDGEEGLGQHFDDAVRFKQP